MNDAQEGRQRGDSGDDVPEEETEDETPARQDADLPPAAEVEEDVDKPVEDDDQKSIEEVADAMEEDMLLGEGVKKFQKDDDRPPPAEITFPASTFFNVAAIEQMMNNRCERAIWPLIGQIDGLQREIEAERQMSSILRQAIEVQKLELDAEKEARAKADAHVLTLFPPIAEQMMAHEQAISDALARSNTIAFAVDEVREMVMTKAEKTSVDQVRRDLDIECETAAARDVNTNKRIDAVDRELPKKISHRECKELVTEVDARLADAIDVVAKEAEDAVQKVATDLEEQGTFLDQKIDQVNKKIPPIITKHEELKTFVDTIPPRVEELE